MKPKRRHPKVGDLVRSRMMPSILGIVLSQDIPFKIDVEALTEDPYFRRYTGSLWLWDVTQWEVISESR